MKKQITTLVRMMIIVLLTFIGFAGITYAQHIDNPYVDHVPQWMLDDYYPSDSELDVITTPDGYDNFDLGVAFAEPHVTTNPLNPLQYFGAYNTNTAYRTTNGHDWITSTPPFGVSANGDPVTAYDSLGNLYYETMFGGITGCKVIRSTDNGATWGASVTAISGNDKNWIAADQSAGPYSNYVYTTMTNSGSGNFARSTNFGASFTNTATFATQTLPGMMVAVGPNTVGVDVPGGCVYVVTHSGTNAAGIYTFYRSTNGGLNFTQQSQHQFSNLIGTQISGRSTVQGMRCRPYPFIAADNSYGPNRGRLYLVYASNNPSGSGNKSDIFLRYSTDQGATWSNAVIVNDDPNSQNNFQFHPAIWCDKQNGRLYIKFYDTRNVPTSDSMDVYATYTDDGGLTFAPNQKLTNRKMRINISGGSGPNYQGDYDAITSSGNVSLAMWTDFRNGGYGSFVGYFPDFAMLMSHTTDTVYVNNDSTMFSVNVPDVKLYDDVANFTAVVTPLPASGTITVTPVGTGSLSTFPGSVQFWARTSGNVTPGNYTITFTGAGPQGIPVHRRTVTLHVSNIIPVELVSFNASVTKEAINLSWVTATEVNNQGFEIERSIENNSIRSEYEKIGFVDGFGTTSAQQLYSFVDKDVATPGRYFYRLRQVDFDGSFEYSSEVAVDIDKPLVFKLDQNYPNPFNPSTTIRYSVPVSELVTLKIYDILGNEVAILVNEQKEAASYEVKFDASQLSSGIYFYKIQAGSFSDTKKLMLMK